MQSSCCQYWQNCALGQFFWWSWENTLYSCFYNALNSENFNILCIHIISIIKWDQSHRFMKSWKRADCSFLMTEMLTQTISTHTHTQKYIYVYSQIKLDIWLYLSLLLVEKHVCVIPYYVNYMSFLGQHLHWVSSSKLLTELQNPFACGAVTSSHTPLINGWNTVTAWNAYRI